MSIAKTVKSVASEMFDSAAAVGMDVSSRCDPVGCGDSMGCTVLECGASAELGAYRR